MPWPPPPHPFDSSADVHLVWVVLSTEHRIGEAQRAVLSCAAMDETCHLGGLKEASQRVACPGIFGSSSRSKPPYSPACSCSSGSSGEPPSGRVTALRVGSSAWPCLWRGYRGDVVEDSRPGPAHHSGMSGGGGRDNPPSTPKAVRPCSTTKHTRPVEPKTLRGHTRPSSRARSRSVAAVDGVWERNAHDGRRRRAVERSHRWTT